MRISVLMTTRLFLFICLLLYLDLMWIVENEAHRKRPIAIFERHLGEMVLADRQAQRPYTASVNQFRKETSQYTTR